MAGLSPKPCKATGLMLLVATWLQWLWLIASAKNRCAAKADWYVCQPWSSATDSIQNEQDWEKKRWSATMHVGRSLLKCERERLHRKFGNVMLLNQSGNLKSVRIGLAFVYYKEFKWERETFASTEFPSLPLLHKKVPSLYTWGGINILPASSFMTVRVIYRNCCGMCLRCDSCSKSLFTGCSIWF